MLGTRGKIWITRILFALLLLGVSFAPGPNDEDDEDFAPTVQQMAYSHGEREHKGREVSTMNETSDLRHISRPTGTHQVVPRATTVASVQTLVALSAFPLRP